MFPDKPAIKDHFKGRFMACVVCTGQVKGAFESRSLSRAPLSQVKSPPTATLFRRQTSRMKNRGKGEEIVIGRVGRPEARLVPFHREQAPRVPGRLAGRIVIAEDFDATPDWLLNAFEGSE